MCIQCESEPGELLRVQGIGMQYAERTGIKGKGFATKKSSNNRRRDLVKQSKQVPWNCDENSIVSGMQRCRMIWSASTGESEGRTSTTL